jgi:hypothetical protein
MNGTYGFPGWRASLTVRHGRGRRRIINRLAVRSGVLEAKAGHALNGKDPWSLYPLKSEVLL